jgi:hypothetical protein
MRESPPGVEPRGLFAFLEGAAAWGGNWSRKPGRRGDLSGVRLLHPPPLVLCHGGVDRYGDGTGCRPVVAPPPGGFDSFRPHHLPRWPNLWQRHRSQNPEVLGSNPRRGTIAGVAQLGRGARSRAWRLWVRIPPPAPPGSVAQSAEAADSKAACCGFDSHRAHPGEVTEPGKVPGCYPEASRQEQAPRNTASMT